MMTANFEWVSLIG